MPAPPVRLVTDGDTIEVWGDGEQTGSYCYIEDCVEGIHRLMRSGHREALNLGQDRMLTINELVDMVAAIAGKRIGKRHDLWQAPGGARFELRDPGLVGGGAVGGRFRPKKTVC